MSDLAGYGGGQWGYDETVGAFAAVTSWTSGEAITTAKGHLERLQRERGEHGLVVTAQVNLDLLTTPLSWPSEQWAAMSSRRSPTWIRVALYTVDTAVDVVHSDAMRAVERPTAGPLPLPMPVYTVAAALRAIERGTALSFRASRRPGVPPAGGWLSLYASRLSGAAGTEHVAVVIEPLQPRTVPLLLSAHGLSEREAEVARLVLRAGRPEPSPTVAAIQRRTGSEPVPRTITRYPGGRRRERAERRAGPPVTSSGGGGGGPRAGRCGIVGAPRKDGAVAGAQWSLVGAGGAPTARLWTRWLTDPDTRERFAAKVHRRGSAECWFWIGAIGSDGHGRFRAGSRPARTSWVITAHVFAYQHAHGLNVERLLHAGVVIRHSCDEASCQNPAHLLPGSPAQNIDDYYARRHRADGPLTDIRGAAGRARAIRAAITTHRGHGAPATEAAIAAAIASGSRHRHQEPLFSLDPAAHGPARGARTRAADAASGP